MGIKVKVNGTWQEVYQNASELPLGTILMWHKSLEARGGTARETGTATTDTTDKLIDSSATFVTNSVAAGDIVYNSTDSTYATVQSVDSETQLTLDWDAFPDGNEAYSVYPEPDIQPGFVVLDGSTIDDEDSPFDGMTVEDAVGSERFFRARETAGRLQADAFQGWQAGLTSVDSDERYGLEVYNDSFINSTARGSLSGRSLVGYETTKQGDATGIYPKSDGTNGTPRTADETRATNLSIIPIVKIKNSGDVKLATYYSVAGDNFHDLTELTSLEDADELVIYDDSAGVYKKVGVDTLRELTPVTADSDWHEVGGSGEPAFQNSWGAYNTSTHDTPRFRKDGFGYVILDGDLGDGTNDTTAFTLPVGYRPGKEKVFASAFSNEETGTANPVLIVEADGDVRPTGGSSFGASISGMRFLAEQ